MIALRGQKEVGTGPDMEVPPPGGGCSLLSCLRRRLGQMMAVHCDITFLRDGGMMATKLTGELQQKRKTLVNYWHVLESHLS